MRSESSPHSSWDLFNFSSTERRLLASLSVLAMSFWIIPELCSGFSSNHLSTLTSSESSLGPSSTPINTGSTASPPQRHYQRKAQPVFELNQADTLDLQSLYGIGPTLARRIVAYRDRLGGFFEVNQLLEVWGMDSSRLQGFQDRIWVDPRLCQKKDLNTADFNALRLFPYLDHYQAKEIYLYRVKKGHIKSFSELESLPLLDPSCLFLLKRYWSIPSSHPRDSL